LHRNHWNILNQHFDQWLKNPILFQTGITWGGIKFMKYLMLFQEDKVS
jgi:hypothetical protein